MSLAEGFKINIRHMSGSGFVADIYGPKGLITIIPLDAEQVLETFNDCRLSLHNMDRYFKSEIGRVQNWYGPVPYVWYGKGSLEEQWDQEKLIMRRWLEGLQADKKHYENLLEMYHVGKW